MQPATNVMPRITAYDNLLRATRDASKGKRFRPEVMAFTDHLNENLEALAQELRDGSYQSGTYRERFVRVPQTRLIQVSSFRDRVAQQAIYGELCPILEKHYIEHSYACRTGKGAIAAAETLQKWLRLISRKPDAKKWVCGKIDIAKFFYRLDHDVILKIMRKYVADETLMRVIEHIICCPHTPFGLPEGMKCTEVSKEERLYDVGVPIGSLMSQTVANMVLNEADQFAKHMLHVHYYIRYMDDILLLAPDLKTLHEWMARIEVFLREELKLRCNRKTQVLPMSHGIPFVGRRIWTSRILPRKSTVKHMKRALLRVAEKYSAGEIELKKALESVNSYYGYLGKMDTPGLERWIENNIVFVRHAREAL